MIAVILLLSLAALALAQPPAAPEPRGPFLPHLSLPFFTVIPSCPPELTLTLPSLRVLLAAPEEFKVLFNTTKGTAVVRVVREWSPFGVDRFYALVKSGYYNSNGLFRVILSPKPFVVQWGIAAKPSISADWNTQIPNDAVVKSNTRGYISYAADQNSQGQACCRTTQIFVNYGDNSRLDAMGFSPFAYVESGMEVLDKLYGGYGEGVDQGQLYQHGNNYLKLNFPKLDYMNAVTFISM